MAVAPPDDSETLLKGGGQEGGARMLEKALSGCQSDPQCHGKSWSC